MLPTSTPLFHALRRAAAIGVVGLLLAACDSESDNIGQILNPPRPTPVLPIPQPTGSVTPSPVATPTPSATPAPTTTPPPVDIIGLSALELRLTGQEFIVPLRAGQSQYVVEIGPNQQGLVEITRIDTLPGSVADRTVGDRIDPNNGLTIFVRPEGATAARQYQVQFVRDNSLATLMAMATEQSCTPFARLDSPPLFLENNTWNVGGLSGDFEQCIYTNANTDGPRMGWTWEFPLEESDGVLSYPEIIFGWKPFMRESSTIALPQRLDLIERLNVTYDVETYTVGDGLNLAFDMWLIDGDVAALDTIRYEVMVWEYRPGGLVPFGDLVATLRTADGRYSLYRGDPDWEPDGAQWIYLALVRDEPRLAGTVDIALMLEALINEGYVDDSLYLSSIGFGNEIGASSGYTVVHDYVIDLGVR